MIQTPGPPTAPPTAAQTARPAEASAGRPAAASEPRDPPAAGAADRPSPAPAPLTLDVERGTGGVFVYTLSNPVTGAIVAVIPDEDVRLGRNGRHVDRRV